MRTLLAEPRALLLDEPFNRLDAELRDEMRQFVFGHARERRLPTLLVTHDDADARAAGARRALRRHVSGRFARFPTHVAGCEGTGCRATCVR